MEQLLLVTFCDSPAGIGAGLWTHARTTHNGWTDRCDIGNSILDHIFSIFHTFEMKNQESKNNLFYKIHNSHELLYTGCVIYKS